MGIDSDRLIYTGAGPLAAVLLGMALVPVRDFTTASNFTFLFLALTILVGEFGGRTAAFATAIVSALSLDFFLTQPYLRLAIQDKHDLIAFLGLAGCGILAATLATERGGVPAKRVPSRDQLAELRSALAELEQAGPTKPRAVASVARVVAQLLADVERALG
jgi:K+-sensing histidine kinase KdpD